MKKNIAIIIGLFMGIANTLTAFGAEGVVKNGRTLVGVRGVFEELGFNVTWNSEKNEAVLSDDTHYISLVKGEDHFFADGTDIKPDVPQQIIGDKFYLPLRAIGDAIGADVSWNEENKIAHITYNAKDVYIKCAVEEKAAPTTFPQKTIFYKDDPLVPDFGALYGLKVVQELEGASGHKYSYYYYQVTDDMVNDYIQRLESCGYIFDKNVTLLKAKYGYDDFVKEYYSREKNIAITFGRFKTIDHFTVDLDTADFRVYISKAIN